MPPEALLPYFPTVQWIRLEENRGGAGGFAESVRRALDLPANWIWLLDDVALRHHTYLLLRGLALTLWTGQGQIPPLRQFMAAIRDSRFILNARA